MSTDNGISKLAMRNNSVLWLIIEPGSKNLNLGATLGETCSWEDFKDIWNSICIELNT